MDSDDVDDGPLFNKRKVPEADLDITPMIDVTFLLLIFFMVGAHMETSRPVDLPVSHTGVGVETDKATAVVLRQDDNPAGTAEPTVEFETGRTGKLDELRRLVRERADAGRREFIIRAERRVPTGLVQQVARAVQETPGTRFFVAVEEEK